MYLISGCVMLTCLIGSATVRSNEEGPCEYPCPNPPQLELTEPAVAANCNLRQGRFRYTCVEGYVRKAGTSNMITCTYRNGKKEWSKSNLSCIRDPKIVITTKQPSVSTSPAPPPPPTSVSSVHLTNQKAREDTPPSQPAPSIPVVALTHADTLPTTPPTSATPPTPATPATPRTTQGTPGGLSEVPATSPTTPGGLGSSAVPRGAEPPGSSEGSSGAAVNAGVSVVVVLVICASAAGLLFWLWRRKKITTRGKGSPNAAELMLMNPGAGAPGPRQ